MDEIVYHDRYRDETRQEKVYGDKSLRWTYGTPAGKLSLHLMVKRAWFSRWYGWLMDRPSSRRKIEPFIEAYDLDSSEFVRRPNEFESFNEFFFVHLGPRQDRLIRGLPRSYFPPTAATSACPTSLGATACL